MENISNTTKTLWERISLHLRLNRSELEQKYCLLQSNIHVTSSFPSLDSLDQLNETVKRKQQLIFSELVNNESFISAVGFSKDQGAATDNITLNRNIRNPNELLNRSNIEGSPPPYSVHDMTNFSYEDQSRNRSAPVPVYYYQQPSPRDASRAPPYQLYDPVITMNLFDDKQKIRKQFITKVYSILSLQLLATFGLVILCVFHRPTKLFFVRNYFVLYMLSTIIFMILMFSFACFQSTRRVVPLNYILLLVFTIAMAIMAATVSSIYSTYIVMLTFAVTAVVCVAITFIACLPCFDITGYFIYLFIAGIILCIYGIISVIITLITKSNIAYMIYSALATLLFSMYLIFDTQQLLAGKRVQLSPEEYIFGAISLYVDIILIFLYILTLCGNR